MNDSTTSALQHGSATVTSDENGQTEPVAGRARAAESAAESNGKDDHLHQILAAVVAFRDGDFSVRLPLSWPGIEGRIAEALNQTIAHEERLTEEVTRLSVTVAEPC